MPTPKLTHAPLDELSVGHAVSTTLISKASQSLSLNTDINDAGQHIMVIDGTSLFDADWSSCWRVTSSDGRRKEIRANNIAEHFGNGRGYRNVGTNHYWDTITASEKTAVAWPANLNVKRPPGTEYMYSREDAVLNRSAGQTIYRPGYVLHGADIHKDDLEVVAYGFSLAVDLSAASTGLFHPMQMHGTGNAFEKVSAWAGSGYKNWGNGSPPLLARMNKSTTIGGDYRLDIQLQCQNFFVLPNKKASNVGWPPPYYQDQDYSEIFTDVARIGNMEVWHIQIACRFDTRPTDEGGGGFFVLRCWQGGTSKPTTFQVDYNGHSGFGQRDGNQSNWFARGFYLPGVGAGGTHIAYHNRFREAWVPSTQGDPFVRANDLEALLDLVDPTVANVLTGGGGSTQQYVLEDKSAGATLTGRTYLSNDGTDLVVDFDTVSAMDTVAWMPIDANFGTTAVETDTGPTFERNYGAISSIAKGQRVIRAEITRSDSSKTTAQATINIEDASTTATTVFSDNFDGTDGSIAGRIPTTAADSRDIWLDTSLVWSLIPQIATNELNFDVQGEGAFVRIHDDVNGIIKHGKVTLDWTPGASKASPIIFIGLTTVPFYVDISTNVNPVYGFGASCTVRMHRNDKGDSLIQRVGMQVDGSWDWEQLNDVDFPSTPTYTNAHRAEITFNYEAGSLRCRVFDTVRAAASSTASGLVTDYVYQELASAIEVPGNVFGVARKNNVTFNAHLFQIDAFGYF